jgi:hypothetical protein
LPNSPPPPLRLTSIRFLTPRSSNRRRRGAPPPELGGAVPAEAERRGRTHHGRRGMASPQTCGAPHANRGPLQRRGAPTQGAIRRPSPRIRQGPGRIQPPDLRTPPPRSPRRNTWRRGRREEREGAAVPCRCLPCDHVDNL